MTPNSAAQISPATSTEGELPSPVLCVLAKADLENDVSLPDHHFESTSTLSGDGKINTEIGPFFSVCGEFMRLKEEN